MQTFLPLPDYQQSLECLDPRRLGNQIWREAKTLARGGWANHPASRMWRGYTGSLCEYALVGLEVLRDRNPKHGYGSGKFYAHVWDFFSELKSRQPHCLEPPWLGCEEFHSSHRAALLFKDPDWYGQFDWSESPSVPDHKGSLPYVWPTVPAAVEMSHEY
jgi:hypothetical protein